MRSLWKYVCGSDRRSRPVTTSTGERFCSADCVPTIAAAAATTPRIASDRPTSDAAPQCAAWAARCTWALPGAFPLRVHHAAGRPQRFRGSRTPSPRRGATSTNDPRLRVAGEVDRCRRRRAPRPSNGRNDARVAPRTARSGSAARSVAAPLDQHAHGVADAARAGALRGHPLRFAQPQRAGDASRASDTWSASTAAGVPFLAAVREEADAVELARCRSIPRGSRRARRARPESRR